MDKVIIAIQKVGFPVVMCLILVYIIFVSLANNTDALNNLTSYLERCSVTIIEK